MNLVEASQFTSSSLMYFLEGYEVTLGSTFFYGGYAIEERRRVPVTVVEVSESPDWSCGFPLYILDDPYISPSVVIPDG